MFWPVYSIVKYSSGCPSQHLLIRTSHFYFLKHRSQLKPGETNQYLTSHSSESMSHDGTKPTYCKSTSKTRMVTCRACPMELLEQNYKDHLKRKHPLEDCNNVRTGTQASVSSYFALPAGRVTRGELHRGPGGTSAAGPAEGLEQVEEGVEQVEEDVDQMEEGVDQSGEGVEEGEGQREAVESDKEETKVPEKLVKEIEKLAKKVSDVDVTDCADDEEKALKRIKVVSNYVNVGQDIRTLDSDVKTLKDSLKIDEETKTKKIEVNADLMLTLAKSLKDITEKVCEFDYEENKDGGKMLCNVCNTEFRFSNELKRDFTDKTKMTREFVNLKNNLKGHLKTRRHMKQVEECAQMEKVKVKEGSRNTAVGVRLGRLVYYLVKKGRPDSDFTTLVQISIANGSDMGEICHSTHFTLKFIPLLAAVVRRRWKEVLSSPMLATGCRPPVNVMADKATHQRETRQLQGLVTLNPGGTQLLVPVFLSAPKCPGGTGELLTSNIVQVLDQYIKGDQIAGFTGDGVYVDCKVVEKLNQHYNISCFETWDGMHLAATVDTALRNPLNKDATKYKWVNMVTEVIGKGVTHVAWGKEWHHFFKVCGLMETKKDFAFKMYRPAAFSETKFANSAAVVYSKFRSTFAALCITLAETAEVRGTYKERERSDKADHILGSIQQVTFALSLSALTDIYSVYGHLSNILQIVNILPHERMDMVTRLLQKFREMTSTTIVETCPCLMVMDEQGNLDMDMDMEDEHEVASDKEKVEKAKDILTELCHWPCLHKDTREVRKTAKYRGVTLRIVTHDVTRTRGDTAQAKGQDTTTEPLVKTVANRAKEVVTFLLEGLSTRLYGSKTVTMVNHCRKLLSLNSDLVRIKTNGAAHVSSLGWSSFKSAAQFFEPELLVRIPEEEFRLQYKEFIRRLGVLAMERGSLELSSISILDKFLNPAQNRYKDIEGPLSVLARAAVTSGVEATVEGWVSVMENHCSAVRGITKQERLEDEVMVAINGPEPTQCEGVVREALRGFKGHFIRRSQAVQFHTVSKAVDRLVNQAPRVPFMQ